MKLGVMPFAQDASLTDPQWMARFCAFVEATPDIESVWSYEHVAFPLEYESRYPYNESGRMPPSAYETDRPDPLHWLSHVAALTTRARLATGLMLLPLHNPLILAKRLATLDRLSAGRVVAGFGIGWLAEEYNALGVPFNKRGALADEGLEVLRKLWQPGPASYDGKLVQFDSVYSAPKPFSSSGPPILIGGHSRPALRRAAKYGDGVFLLIDVAEELVPLMEVLDEELAAVGRTREGFEVIVKAPREPAVLIELEEAGATSALLSARSDDLDRFEDRVQRYLSEAVLEPVAVAG